MKNLVSENQNNNPRAIANNLVVQELKDETLIYNLVADRAICLNSTAAFVWNKCDGQTSVAEISRELAHKTNQPVNEDIVWLALDLLEKENLIDDIGQTTAHFGEMSRREIIRRVALATMISLPLISGLAAPRAAHGASTGSPNGACSSNCLTGLGGICACLGSVTCAPGFTLGANVGVGVCVDLSVAVDAGINVSAGANGNVCLFTSACIRL